MSYKVTASYKIMITNEIPTITNEILRKVDIGGREYNLSRTKLYFVIL